MSVRRSLRGAGSIRWLGCLLGECGLSGPGYESPSARSLTDMVWMGLESVGRVCSR
jgi:hypothetical protein